MNMNQVKKNLWPFVWGLWSVLMVAAVILLFFLDNPAGLPGIRYLGWAVLVISAIFGWLPIFEFRGKGAVPDGESYIKTTVLVDSGIYAVVRHPQYLAGMLLSLALILVSQHWIMVVIGVVAMGLNYAIAVRADQDLIEKFGDDYQRYMQQVPRMNFLLGLVRWLRRRES